MKERIGLDFFAKAFYPSQLKARGDALYFIGKRTDMERNTYDSDLYTIKDGEPFRLTTSSNVKTYTLVDDGIVFPCLRNEKDKERVKKGEHLTVYQRLPYDGGEAQEHLRLPHQVVQAEFLPDNRILFRAVYDHALQSFLLEYGGDMEKALKEMKEQGDTLTVIDELPFWGNGEGFTNKKRTALYLYDNGTISMLSDPYADVDEIKLNADKSAALFTQVRYENKMPLVNQLYRMDIASSEIRHLAGVPEGSVAGYTFGPQGKIIFLHTPPDAPHGPICSNSNLCLLDEASGIAEVIDDSGRYDYYNSIGSDAKMGNVDSGLTLQGDGIAFLCTLMHNSHIMRYDLESRDFAQITRPDGMVCEFTPYGSEGGYAMIAMRGLQLPEIYSVGADGTETRISAFNDALLEAHETVTPLEIRFTNKQNTEICGWVMPPVDYVPGMVYPAILNIHGGPKTAYGNVFFHEMQYWCAQGYAVLFCNPTGSDGRGSDFADIRGRYGTVDYDDIMQFVQEATTKFGFISTVRMGVTGGSYGGFMTNWIIGHTDFFRAAASQRSISNWLGFHNTSDIGYFFGADQMQATPWSDYRKLWKASPLRYADKVTTPTLFIHSDEDYRCNQFEGIQMYTALKDNGVDTRMCLFKGENHELSRSGKPKGRIRRLQEITRWMDKYLKTV